MYSGVEDAYAAALTLDTIEAYEQFLALYPSTRYSRRVAAMLAVRREEIIWRHCVFDNTPRAYWSYMRGYPTVSAHPGRAASVGHACRAARSRT